MQEILERLRFRSVAEAFANEILDRLDVVIGGRLDVLDAFGIVEREVVDDVVQHVLHDRRTIGPSSVICGLVRQALQPAHLDQHPEPDQAVFAEDVAEAVDLVGIAAVSRREGSQSGDFHVRKTSVDLRAQSANHTPFLAIEAVQDGT